MGQPCPKQYATPAELVQSLKQRGLTINDEKKAAEYIQTIDLHQFQSDSRFSKVMKL